MKFVAELVGAMNGEVEEVPGAGVPKPAGAGATPPPIGAAGYKLPAGTGGTVALKRVGGSISQIMRQRLSRSS